MDPNQANVTPNTETVPSSWPGAWGVYKYSQNAVRLNVVTIIVLYLLSIVGLGALSAVLKQVGLSQAVIQIVTNLVGIWLSVAVTLVIIRGVQQQKTSIGQSLQQSLPFYLKALVLSILTCVITVASLLLFIVPFFFVFPRLALAMYYLLDKNLGPVESLKASWNATHGNVGKVYGIVGVTIVFALLIFVIVGIYFLTMYLAATVVLYFYLQQPQQPAAAPIAPTDAEPPVVPTA